MASEGKKALSHDSGVSCIMRLFAVLSKPCSSPLTSHLNFNLSPPDQNTSIAIMAKSADSPLLALAGELRNEIWRLVVLERDPIKVRGVSSPNEPALLAFNEQIRKEAIKIHYGENTFEFRAQPIPQHQGYNFTSTSITQGYSFTSIAAPAWLVCIGDERAGVIRNFILNHVHPAHVPSGFWLATFYDFGGPVDEAQRLERQALEYTRVHEYVDVLTTYSGLALEALHVAWPEDPPHPALGSNPAQNFRWIHRYEQECKLNAEWRVFAKQTVVAQCALRISLKTKAENLGTAQNPGEALWSVNDEKPWF